jgi:hypothetical protein
MTQERRENTLENILLKIGHIEEIGTQNHESLIALNQKVAIQNGRVGVLENWKAYMLGAIAVLSFLVCSILIPISIWWLHNLFNKMQ